MGGVRGALHYMQRTALQGSPTTLTAISNEWIKGAAAPTDSVHPFRKYFDELEIGETLITEKRTITEADTEKFADLSGDHFYAHMDDAAAKKWAACAARFITCSAQHFRDHQPLSPQFQTSGSGERQNPRIAFIHSANISTN